MGESELSQLEPNKDHREMRASTDTECCTWPEPIAGASGGVRHLANEFKY